MMRAWRCSPRWRKSKTCFLMTLVTIGLTNIVLLGWMKNINGKPTRALSYTTSIQSTTHIGNNLAQPHVNFSFIKIHRTGSGTFHNVLVRFAINHNAFVALADAPYYQVFPRQISRKLLLPDPLHPNFTGYNMFIDHVIFNKTATDEILPKDVRYITQIRHPYTHASAIYMKMGKGRSYKWHNNTGTTMTPDEIKTPGNLQFSITRNMMALELGYYKKQVQNNITDFLPYLDVVDKQLFHVNILEDLSRSLVLLKRKMNWELKDVMHLRIHTNRKYTPLPDEAQLQHHRQWSSLDYALYDHFLTRHKKEIAQQDASFDKEVKAFDEMQDDFSKFCSSIIEDFKKLDHSNVTCLQDAMDKSHVIPSSSFHVAFKVTYADCAMLRVNETVAKKALKYHMNPGACEIDPGLAKKLRLACETKTHVLPGLTDHDLNEIVHNKPMRENM